MSTLQPAGSEKEEISSLPLEFNPDMTDIIPVYISLAITSSHDPIYIQGKFEKCSLFSHAQLNCEGFCLLF